ncbi:MAG: DUF59 domain-containing protein [Nitrospirae bacterium]|nr:DUF59 domain-containing protein [Nitrospirota bacterium]
MEKDIKEEVMGALSHVVDPELGVNIVDLGLVYHIEADADRVHVQMTVTAPGCPMGTHLLEMARNAIEANVPGSPEISVDLVWDPPWNPMMMSPIARQQLGWNE